MKKFFVFIAMFFIVSGFISTNLNSTIYYFNDGNWSQYGPVTAPGKPCAGTFYTQVGTRQDGGIIISRILVLCDKTPNVTCYTVLPGLGVEVCDTWNGVGPILTFTAYSD